MQKLLARLCAATGKTALYYQPLDGSGGMEYNADLPLLAASVIKIPVMVEAFRRFECGELDPEAKHVLSDGERMPSCGCLNRLHAGIELTMMDLVELMIILSDNTATNILIDQLGIDSINATLRSLGIANSTIRRKLFDAAGHAAGIENTVTARDMGLLLKLTHEGKLISEAASARMIDILKAQRLNGKLPFFLKSRGVSVAHKTGEDDGITNDVGIVYARQPFVLCMLSNETEVPVFERLMQDMALELCVRAGS